VAAGIGGKTVDELNEAMTVSEFQRWEAYYSMFPFGNDDLNFGRLLHLLASIYAPKGNRPKLVDYLLGDLPEQAPAPEELEYKMQALAQRIPHED
jgi:hypothetical protein